MVLAYKQMKKPKRINSVSVTMTLFFALCVYVAYSLFPVARIWSAARTELLDALPGLWRAGNQTETAFRATANEVKISMVKRLQALGVHDRNLKVVVTRDKKKVTASAHFTTVATFPWINKSISFSLSPSAETDSARVEW